MAYTKTGKQWLSLLLILVLLISTIPATAITIPETLPTAKQYTYTDTGTNGLTVSANSSNVSTVLFNMKGGTPEEPFKAWCIDVANTISSAENAYLLMPLEWLALNQGYVNDANLTLEDTTFIRAILYEILVVRQTREALATAAGITGTLSDSAFVTGVQAALWNRVANNVSITGSGTDQVNARALYAYLNELAAKPEKVDAATTSLSISPITAASYVTADTVDVTVSYTVSGQNYDGSSLTGVQLTGLPSGVTVEPASFDADNLVTNGTEQTLTLKGISDVTSLNLAISGTQLQGYKAYGLATRQDPGTRDQSLLLHELFPIHTALTATASMDLSTARGSLTVAKTLNNTVSQIGSFSMTLQRTAPFTGTSTPVTLSGNASTTFNGLRYGTYKVVESTVPLGFAIVQDEDTGVVAANSQPTLTIINRKLGSIRVEKNVQDSTEDTTPFALKLTKSGDESFSRMDSVSEAASFTFTNLEPGTYTVTETLPLPTGYREVVASGTYTVTEAGSDGIVSLTNLKEDPMISLSKTIVSPTAGPIRPGDVVTYQITVSNDGNIPLTGLSFVDSLVSPLAAKTGSIPATLAVNGTATFTYDYTVKQDDYGRINNIITVNTNETEPKSDDASFFVDVHGDLQVVKTASTLTALTGETISYQMTITNNGNLPLVNLSWNDPLTGQSGSIDGTLMPGASHGPVELGSTTAGVSEVTNTVVVIGDMEIPNPEDPEGEPSHEEISGSSTVITQVLTSGISLTKQVDKRMVLENEVVQYTFTITNTGTSTLESIVLSDSLLGITVSLAGGTTQSFVSEWYPVSGLMNSQGFDAETRKVTNTATVTATSVREGSDYSIPVQDSASASFTVLRPGLDITKKVAMGNWTQVNALGSTPWQDAVDAYVGDWVTYRITVTNTGETLTIGNDTRGYDLVDVSVSDSMLGLEEVLSSLAVGQTITFDVPYQVSEEDETSRNTIVNTALANTNNPALSDQDQATVNVLKPELSITKTANASSVQAGSVITYTITVSNTGNVPLMGVEVVDAMDGADPVVLTEMLDLDIAGGEGADSQTFTRTYQTSSAFSGLIWNTATAEGWTIHEREVAPEMDRVSVNVVIPVNPPPPVVNVTLTVGIEGQGTVSPGIGSYTRTQNSVQQFSNINPAEGWKFVGWFGTDGDEIDANSRLLMNTDKSVIARFEPILTEMDEEPTPEGDPVVELEPEPEQEETPIDELLLDEEVPLDVPALPQTSGLPLGLLIGLGSMLTSLGIARKRKNR